MRECVVLQRMEMEIVRHIKAIERMKIGRKQLIAAELESSL